MSTLLSNGMTIAYAMLCDDVRREDNGKFIFIGVYANDIVLSSFPANLAFRLVTRLLVPGPGHYECDIRLCFNGDCGLQMRFKTESVDGSPETTASPGFGMEIKEPGVLTFEVRAKDTEEWVTFLQFPVGPLPSPGV